jgi:MFS family permease
VPQPGVRVADVSADQIASPSRGKWATLAVVSIGTLMSTLDGGMVGVSFPALSEAFDVGSSTILWVSVAFWATSFGLLPTLGWLGDVHGRKRVYTLGSLVFAFGILAAEKKRRREIKKEKRERGKK